MNSKGCERRLLVRTVGRGNWNAILAPSETYSFELSKGLAKYFYKVQGVGDEIVGPRGEEIWLKRYIGPRRDLFFQTLDWSDKIFFQTSSGSREDCRPGQLAEAAGTLY